MLDGFHRSYNGHALASLTRTVDTPAISLGVGWAEKTTITPVQFVVHGTKPTRIVVMESDSDFTKANLDGSTPRIDEKMFPRTGWMGDFLAGDY